MAVGNANNGAGWDHVCTQDTRHGTWEPTEHRDGKRCPILVRGNQCQGKLKVVGAGSRTLAKAAA